MQNRLVRHDASRLLFIDNNSLFYSVARVTGNRISNNSVQRRED